MSTKKVEKNIKLIQLRKRIGFSNQKEFASFLGVSERTVSLWESKNQDPSTDALKILADRKNVNLNWLLTGGGEMFIYHEHEEEDSQETGYKEVNSDEISIKDGGALDDYKNMILRLTKENFSLKDEIQDLRDYISRISREFSQDQIERDENLLKKDAS